VTSEKSSRVTISKLDIDLTFWVELSVDPAAGPGQYLRDSQFVF